MKNLRSVGALLAISAAFSCATAINDSVPDDLPQHVVAEAGSGGSGELGGEGGSPAGGSPQVAGAPGGAGKVETGKGGSGSAGSGGKGGSTGKGGGGGTVGVGGAAAGSNAGGKAGTSSGGDGGSAAGSDGGSGGAGTMPCADPKDVTGGQSGNFKTKAAVCFRTKESFNTVGCSNFAGRTMKVNGALAMCMVKTAFPPAIDGWNYFDVSAGDSVDANFAWYSQ